MRILLALVAASTLLLAGCSARGPIEPAPASASASASASSVLSSGEYTITVDGAERDYILTVPDGLPARAPLVVMLHGGFGSAAQAQEAYGWDELAASAGFVVAYPDGLGRAWNAGDGCCGTSGNAGVDDVAFVEAMVAEIEAGVGIDGSRVFATGMSNGAMMSYRLACDTTLFAAIAPVAGTLLGSCDSPAPVSVLHIHGLADQNVRMDGEPGAGFATIDGTPMVELIESWRLIDGCAPADAATEGPVTTSVAACPAGRTVELITVAGAGHQWPGSDPVRGGADSPSTALDTTATIWEFFAGHPAA